MKDHWNEIIIFRCDCRDWPVHRHAAYGPRARCVLCKAECKIIDEPYPEEKYARNQQTYYES